MDLKLVELFLAVALVEFDAEIRFRAMAARGSVEVGLVLLEKLDSESSS